MVRNLAYFLFPRSGSNWQEAVAELLPHMHKFNGRRIITVAEDDSTDELSEVVEAFQGVRAEFAAVVNDRRLGEMPHFLDALDRMDDGREGITLYAHAKGVSYLADGKYV